jgi:hypothetical protein
MPDLQGMRPGFDLPCTAAMIIPLPNFYILSSVYTSRMDEVAMPSEQGRKHQMSTGTLAEKFIQVSIYILIGVTAVGILHLVSMAVTEYSTGQWMAVIALMIQVLMILVGLIGVALLLFLKSAMKSLD